MKTYSLWVTQSLCTNSIWERRRHYWPLGGSCGCQLNLQSHFCFWLYWINLYNCVFSQLTLKKAGETSHESQTSNTTLMDNKPVDEIIYCWVYAVKWYRFSNNSSTGLLSIIVVLHFFLYSMNDSTLITILSSKASISLQLSYPWCSLFLRIQKECYPQKVHHKFIE